MNVERHHREAQAPPRIDVLLCTYERPSMLLDVVADLRAQLRPEDGVLIVDQSVRVQPTRDALGALGDPRLRHVAAPPLGLPAARNRALAETSAPLVVFFDDDVRLEPGCLDAHRQALAQDGVGATVGRVDDRGMRWNSRRTRNAVSRAGRVRVNLSGEEAVDVESVQGCNMGFRRQVLEAVGGFDPGFAGTAFLEEADVAASIRAAGWRIRFVPDAALVHLAAGAGGVRVGDRLQTARWRFHNTGRYLAKHRGVGGVAVGATAFSALAARTAVRLGAPGAAATLMTAFWAGVRGRKS